MLGNRKKHGDFSIFGIVRDGVGVKGRIAERLGIEVKTFPLGSAWTVFYASTYADIAENEEAVVLKLGFVRSNTKTSLSARDLLAHKLVGAGKIETEGFSGNGLVIALSKRDASFTAFQTLLAVPQLYYWQSGEGIVCSDVLRALVQVHPCPTLNEAILPQHFLFRSVYGSATYYEGIERMISGHLLRWREGRLETKLVRSLDVVAEEGQYIRQEKKALELLDEALESVVGDYVRQIEGTGQGYGNLLSGGVDSTLVQYYINHTSSQKKQRSISYAVQVPAFQFEVDYARQASEILGTDHTFVEYTPQDFPSMLVRVVDVLAQPPNLEIEPSFLAVAEHIRDEGLPERYWFSANAADSVFGNSDTWKLKGLDILKNVPGSVQVMRLMGQIAEPVYPDRAQTLIKGAEVIAERNNPDAYCSPSNTMGVTVFGDDWKIVNRFFGDQAVKEALATRRNLAARYSHSDHYLDKVHYIDQLSYTYEIAVQENQIFLANGREQVHIFNDEDLLKASLTIHPNIRYIKGFRPKYLLKELLYRKTQAPVAHSRKGGSAVNEDLIRWMSTGPLRPMMDAIGPYNFMTRDDLTKMLQSPKYFLWSLLTLDVFVKQIHGNSK